MTIHNRSFRITINVFAIAALVLGGFFSNVSQALAVTGTFTTNETVANVTASVIPSVTFAGGAEAVNGSVPPITFAGGANAITSTIPAITFAGGLNGAAATATITISAGSAATSADHSITIDGVIINLGTSARNATSVANVIAGADYTTGTSYQADGDYTVDNTGAVITFTRVSNGAAGNADLVIADADYISVKEVKATRTITVSATPANGVNLTIGTCVITFNTAATQDVNCSDNAAAINTTTDSSNPLIAARLRTLTNVTDAAHGALTVGETGNQASFTTTGTETSATVITASISGSGINVNSVNTAGVILVIGTVPAIDFTGGVTEAAASASVVIPAGLAANATDHSVTIDAVVIDLGTSALTANQVAAAIDANPFTGKNYTVTNPTDANLVFTRNTVGAAGNGSLTIQDANYTTTNAVAAVSTFTIVDSLAANATDHSITIDGVTIDIGVLARTAVQIAAAIAANPFSGKPYTVTNPVSENLVFTRNTAGAAGNGALTVQDSSYTKTNAVPAAATITVPSGLAAAAFDHSITIDAVVIDLGTAALTATQVAAAIAANPFTGKNYTVTNPTGADLTFTRTTGGTAGNGALILQDASYGSVAQVVTFTPALVTADETFRATINGTIYDYKAQAADTVAIVVAALAPLMDANGAVDCTEDGLKITCSATAAGTAFTFAATVFAGPILNSVHIQSNNANSTFAKVGDNVTLTFSSPDNLQNPVVTIAGNSTAVTGSGSGPYTATYMMTGTDTEGSVTFTINFQDTSSNPGIQVTATTDSSAVSFDKTLPTVNAGADQATTTLFTQSGVATDSGSGINTIAWTMFSGGPGTITFGTPNAATTTVSASVDGTYVLRLQATDNAGNSSFDEFTLVWGTGGGDTQAPTVPTNLQVTGTTASTVSLSWSASTDNVAVTGYDVLLGTSLVSGGAATSATISGLSGSTSYTFTVRAKDAAGNVSAASNAVSATTQVQAGGGGGGGGGGGTVTQNPIPALPNTGLVTAIPAPTGAHPNGTLIVDGQTFYLIKNGQKIGFRDPNEYASYGYNFSQGVIANAIDKSLATGSPAIMKAMEGTLVLDAVDGRTVYMIGTGNTKRGFTSAAVFTGLGYSFFGVPKINLIDYPEGSPIGSLTDAHPDGSLVLDGNTIWWLHGIQKLGFESMAVFNTYGFSLSRVVTANSSDLAVPTGPLVKFRDGTLVNDGVSYYLISDSKKLQFSSVIDLTARGYKTSNAIMTSLINYQSGGTVQ